MEWRSKVANDDLFSTAGAMPDTRRAGYGA